MVGRLTLFLCSVLFGILLIQCHSSDGELPAIVDFNYHIRPILSDRCFACHGPDDKAREGDLKLHTPEGAFAALDGNAERFIIKPGHTDQSELYHRIVSNEPDYMMPPPSSNLVLLASEKELIAKWIEQGAPWQDHWSFIPPTRPTPPKISSKWSDHPIDLFVKAKMKTASLKPNDQAEKGKLIRRVYFDVTGLPPSLSEVEQFVKDDSPDAIEKMIDAALAKPAYGERMATIWLDLARYADSHGYQDDRQRSMWPWRNWVIDAFNKNMPYDQFVTWQLAGDLLEDPSYEQKLATGFNRNHPITQEGGVINEEYLTEYAADRTDVFATSFLGMTMQCARCHDHKYDPISQEEYYQIFAFFNNLRDERGQISYFDQSPEPSIPEENPQREKEIEEIKKAIAKLEETQADLPNQTSDFFDDWKNKNIGQSFYPPEIHRQAHFSIDEKEGWTFDESRQKSNPAKVNINLPPEINRPVKVPGMSGQALEFNGDNFLSLGDLGDFDHYDDFTIGAWVKQKGNLDRVAGILAKRNGELGREGYDLFMSANGQIGFRLVAEMKRGYTEVVTRKRVPSHRWHHIVATYNGSGKADGIQIFINGQKEALITVRDSLMGRSILNGNDFIVGNWNHRARKLKDLWGFKGGTVDEPMIFDRQLSALEIKQLFHGEEAKLSPTDRQWKEHYLLTRSNDFQKIRSQLDSLRSIDLSIPKVMIMEERDTLKPTFVLSRGAYDAHEKEVNRNTPKAVLAFDEDLPRNRLGLSQWLFDKENPLTARVMVNRLWQQCFGRGLVATPEDFGSQGKLPSHPALLDWLAVEFIESNWDIKHLLKLVLMSKTYQQAGDLTSNKLTVDPENIWLARGPHQPLSAEMLRDQALKLTGLLNPKIGGKWVKPYQPAGIWKALANQIGENKYRPSRGSDLYRRSLYTYWKRTIPPPTMLTLDAPERSVCTVKRQATSTPLQALVLLNDPQYVEASRVLAHRLIEEHRSDDGTPEIKHAFKLFTSRNPTAIEVNNMLQLFQELQDDFAMNDDAVSDWLNIGATKLAEAERTPKLAAMTATISTIINLDEAKYK